MGPIGNDTNYFTYRALRPCLSSDHSSIYKIIQSTQLPETILLEIATKIEKEDGNSALAHSIRKCARTLNSTIVD